MATQIAIFDLFSNEESHIIEDDINMFLLKNPDAVLIHATDSHMIFMYQTFKEI